jgi:carbon storage regulator
MLVLSRKKNEILVFYHEGVRFEVMVSDIEGDRVRLGINAPNTVRVYRKEVDRSTPEELVS